MGFMEVPPIRQGRGATSARLQALLFSGRPGQIAASHIGVREKRDTALRQASTVVRSTVISHAPEPAMEKRKRPRDTNQLRKRIVNIATGQIDDAVEPVNQARQEAERKGGEARARSLGSAKRKPVAREAAEARWAS